MPGVGCRARPRFDVAFLDPPYDFDGWDPVLAALPATLAVTESDRTIALPDGWGLVRERRYGTTVVQILRSLVPWSEPVDPRPLPGVF